MASVDILLTSHYEYDFGIFNPELKFVCDKTEEKLTVIDLGTEWPTGGDVISLSPHKTYILSSKLFSNNIESMIGHCKVRVLLRHVISTGFPLLKYKLEGEESCDLKFNDPVYFLPFND